MKLLIVTCLKEYLADVARIFKQANIDVFSTSDITGHREGTSPNLLEDWFASGAAQYDSLMVFSFTNEASAGQGMELIKQYNETLKENFPVRAFMLPVEKTI